MFKLFFFFGVELDVDSTFNKRFQPTSYSHGELSHRFFPLRVSNSAMWKKQKQNSNMQLLHAESFTDSPYWNGANPRQNPQWNPTLNFENPLRFCTELFSVENLLYAHSYRENTDSMNFSESSYIYSISSPEWAPYRSESPQHAHFSTWKMPAAVENICLIH